MAEHNELTEFCKLHNQQQQALPKINIKICRCSQIVPNLLGLNFLNLSRLNDAIQRGIAESRAQSTLACIRHRCVNGPNGRGEMWRRASTWSAPDECRFLEKGDMTCTVAHQRAPPRWQAASAEDTSADYLCFAV